MSKKSKEPKISVIALGGNNEDKIGGNCSIVEVEVAGKTYRYMVDLGSKFVPYDTGLDMILPDVSDYFDLEDEKGNVTPAKKPIDGLFFTHGHQDHIGGITEIANMGYKMPPLYASEFVAHKLRRAFSNNDLGKPKIRPFNNGMNVKFGNNEEVEIEAVSLPHSALEAQAIHVLVKEKNEQKIGLMHYGDFFVGENAIGKVKDMSAHDELLARKIITHASMDATSLTDSKEERLSFEQLVNNTLDVVNEHKGKVVISPVISGSIQNMAIDVEVARRLGKKICLDGKNLKEEYEDMRKAGYKDFDDVIYKGSVAGYLMEVPESEQYFCCSGAFAQGLEEYKKNRGHGNNIWLSSGVKMALGLSDTHSVGKNSLFIFRQRDITDITGKYGAEMLNLIASKGASIVCSPSEAAKGKYKIVKMQESGHTNFAGFKKIAKDGVTYISTHGNKEQRENASKLMARHLNGASTYFFPNMQKINLLQNGRVEFDGQPKQEFWIAVKKENLTNNPNNRDVNSKYTLVSNVDFQEVYPICEITPKIKQDRREVRIKEYTENTRFEAASRKAKYKNSGRGR